MLLFLQNYTVDDCGIVHIVVGDGGNIEGLCKPPARPLILYAAAAFHQLFSILQPGTFRCTQLHVPRI